MNNLAKKMISYIQSNIIMSWSNIHKCILVLVLAILIHLIWIMWKVYILITPTLWQWLNISLLKNQLMINIISIICLTILIIINRSLS